MSQPPSIMLLRSPFSLPQKENIPDAVISKIQPYIDNEDFTPQAISKVSKACTSICQWVRAMHKYYFVSKAVAPKRVSAFTLCRW